MKRTYTITIEPASPAEVAEGFLARYEVLGEEGAFCASGVSGPSETFEQAHAMAVAALLRHMDRDQRVAEVRAKVSQAVDEGASDAS